jgi:DNA replication protein DnaC
LKDRTTRARHTHPDALSVQAKLTALNLPFMRENYQSLAQTAADKHWSHVDYFTELLTGEAAAREDRRVQRCIRQARFPVLKTIDKFDWAWPYQDQPAAGPEPVPPGLRGPPRQRGVHLRRGPGQEPSDDRPGLHRVPARALGAVHRAIDIVNTLTTAHAAGGMKKALAAYVKPEVLCIDELGYLPIDKFGADSLFQIISHRYERGSTMLTTNRPYKHWAEIFNNDATLTSALLDRLLDHVETVVIEGKSYRGQSHANV